MPTKIQLRRATSASWAAVNPVLSDGEQGYDTTLKLTKTGDGVTAWNALKFDFASGSMIKGAAIVNQPVVVSTRYVVAHGLGRQPDIARWYLECVSASIGYAVGDRLYSANSSVPAVGSDATNLWVTQNSTIFNITPKLGGAAVAGIAGAWRINAECWIIK